MTPTDLETLRELVKLSRKVTQGPWHSYWRTGGDTTDCGVTSERGYAVYRAPRYQNEKQWKADGDFAVAMQAAIPALTALLAEYERMRVWLMNHNVEHLSSCALFESYEAGCNCGLNALRATLMGERG